MTKTNKCRYLEYNFTYFFGVVELGEDIDAAGVACKTTPWNRFPNALSHFADSRKYPRAVDRPTM